MSLELGARRLPAPLPVAPDATLWPLHPPLVGGVLAGFLQQPTISAIFTLNLFPSVGHPSSLTISSSDPFQNCLIGDSRYNKYVPAPIGALPSIFLPRTVTVAASFEALGREAYYMAYDSNFQLSKFDHCRGISATWVVSLYSNNTLLAFLTCRRANADAKTTAPKQTQRRVVRFGPCPSDLVLLANSPPPDR